MKQNSNDDHPLEVVYHADPLCGWCFAIADELAEARLRLGDQVTWTLRMGGLVVGERVRPIADDAQYLRSGLQQVEQVSGRVASDRYFSEIVDDGTWVSNSESVCMIVLAAIELAGTDAGFTASHRLCDLLYIDGVEPDSQEAVDEIARAVDLAERSFSDHLASPGLRRRLAEHWVETRRMGLETYPTIAVRSADGLQPVVTGFADATTIVGRVRDRSVHSGD